MPIQTSDFQSLTDDLQDIFEEVASQKVSDNVGLTIFNVFDTERQTYDHLVLHGIAGVKKVTPGQDLPKITGEEGRQIALYKFLLINGENLKTAFKRFTATLNKQMIDIILQLQRLSEETVILAEATV